MKMSEKNIRVRAEDGYQAKQLKDNELHEIPIKGQEWYVSKERLEELKTAEKKYGVTFVKVIKHTPEKEDAEEENKQEKEPEEAKKETAVKKEPRKRNAKK